LVLNQRKIKHMTGEIKQLDSTGRKILSLLQQQARLPFSQIGQQIGLSGPAVAERVRRMEEDGLIKGYHAEIDPDAAGLPIRAFIRLQTSPERYPRLIKTLEEIPEVLEANHVTGEDAFYLRVAAESMEALEQVIGRLSPFGSTSTAMILSTPINRGLPIL
jgi:Lrp/AsnC family transcriptional regulator, leucine-responsive regulatory protein